MPQGLRSVADIVRNLYLEASGLRLALDEDVLHWALSGGRSSEAKTTSGLSANGPGTGQNGPRQLKGMIRSGRITIDGEVRCERIDGFDPLGVAGAMLVLSGWAPVKGSLGM